VVLAVVGAGVLAGVGRQMRGALLLAVPLALTIAVINALVARDGLTVIARLGDLPILGNTQVTLEATAYGGILGLRAAALILCGALYTAAVDPDEVLAMFGRVSFRSALTATLATRLVPVLVRDSRRLADAQRCRPGRRPTRVALMRATTAGVFDRALDVAAALEVRGYGARPPGSPRPPNSRGSRGPRGPRGPRGRHDFLFAGAALAVAALAVWARVGGLAPFRAYPSLHSPVNLSTVLVGVGLLACSWLPFAERRGVER
jgi:energy-coupling factor transport system permease protein